MKYLWRWSVAWLLLSIAFGSVFICQIATGDYGQTLWMKALGSLAMLGLCLKKEKVPLGFLLRGSFWFGLFWVIATGATAMREWTTGEYHAVPWLFVFFCWAMREIHLIKEKTVWIKAKEDGNWVMPVRIEP